MRKAEHPTHFGSLITYPAQSRVQVKPLLYKILMSCMMLVMLLFGLLAKAEVAMASLDPNFGTGGKVLTGFTANKAEVGEKVLVQPDGKIVVVGYTYSILCIFPCFAVPDPILARYNTDGTLDSTFGNGGRVETILSARAFAYDAALQPDGKIVVVGTYDPSIPNNSHDYLVMRYNSNGTLDTTFDGDGVATISFGPNREDAKAVGLQSDGKIVVVGVSKDYYNDPYTVMVRFNPDGSFDSSFGTSGGIIIVGVYTYNALLIQPDNKILLGGGGNTFLFNGQTVNANAQVARFNSNGTIDTGFGSANAVADVDFAPGFGELVNALALQPDGKIILAASAGGFSLARLNPNGTIDPSFGENGKASTIFPPGGFGANALALAVQPDGRIVVAGQSPQPEFGYNFALARFNPNGSVSGKITTDFDLRSDVARSVAIQPDGKIVAAGDSQAGSAPSVFIDLAVARYLDIAQQFRVPQFDFDGDAKSDIAVYRPGATANAPSYWHILRSSNNSYLQIQFGSGQDIYVPADYDGNGTTDAAVFRPGAGTWYTSLDPAINYGAIQWGQSGDIPAPGDYNNDGKADLCVYRPSNGVWYIRITGLGSTIIRQFGGSLDKPVAADYDGDGQTDIAYVTTSGGNLVWNIIDSSTGIARAVQYGISGDKSVPADYNGDGSMEIAVFRPATGSWFTSLSPANNYGEVQWGASGDIPAAADYDGDGKADHTVFRPSNSTFYIRQSTNLGLSFRQWGISTDAPVPSAYVR